MKSKKRKKAVAVKDESKSIVWTIRTSKELKKALDTRAKSEKRKVNGMAVILLSESIGLSAL